MAGEVLELFRRVDRSRWVNREGGDVGCSGSPRSLLRHTANYLMAARLAAAEQLPAGPVVDVGGGVGALGFWLAAELDRPLWLVDTDPKVLRAAEESFPGIQTFASLRQVPAHQGAVVAAMEVIEHVRPTDQAAFVADLRRVTRPEGLLVMSTPDETRCLGGWSGYAPHVGVLSAAELGALLDDGSNAGTAVWRLSGDPFTPGFVQRLVHPVVNRLWTLSQRVVPGPTRVIGQAAAALQSSLRGWGGEGPVSLEGEVLATPPAASSGDGLLAAVKVPAQPAGASTRPGTNS